jgi:hypothetical protein
MDGKSVVERIRTKPLNLRDGFDVRRLVSVDPRKSPNGTKHQDSLVQSESNMALTIGFHLVPSGKIPGHPEAEQKQNFPEIEETVFPSAVNRL